jgi:hypothetical protein
MLQPPRAIPIPPQPKLQPHQLPPPQVIAAWSKSARSLAAQHLAPEADRASPEKLMPVMPPVITLPVRPLIPLPEPVPPQALPRPQTPQPAAHTKASDRFDPGSQQAPVAQKVVLYEEEPDANGKRFVGSVVWRTETVSAGLGQPPELAIRADIEVPERKVAVTWSLRRNTDKGLPATHVVDILFKLSADFPDGGISNVPGILMKQGEQTRGVPIAGLAVKVTSDFYLIGLSNQEADKERNLQLLKERGWVDIPVVYNNKRRAILAIEKGLPGERAFADAFTAWDQYEHDDAACRGSRMQPGSPAYIACRQSYDDQRRNATPR